LSADRNSAVASILNSNAENLDRAKERERESERERERKRSQSPPSGAVNQFVYTRSNLPLQISHRICYDRSGKSVRTDRAAHCELSRHGTLWLFVSGVVVKAIVKGIVFVLSLLKVVTLCFFVCGLQRWKLIMCERQNTIYELLISGAHAFRIMRLMNGFILKCVLVIRK
jgi:hypothetical protein